MKKPVHVISISGGKDSTATMILAVLWIIKRGIDLDRVRFVFADTGNEHEMTLDHVAYLSDWLFSMIGKRIETVRADFSHMFAARRESIAKLWPHEQKRREHLRDCHRKGECDCPWRISPPVPDDLIAQAIELMQPTGNPFLDMCMLHGRFPGARTRFCTDELKLRPMDQMIKLPFLNAGRSIIEWVGERAEESPARAAKPIIERLRWGFDISGPKAIELDQPAWRIMYRPIHSWLAAQTFELAAAHGIKPNPLYLMGMGRVRCMPCIMCKKGELAQIAKRFPEHIDRLEEWERIVALVSRRQAATFFAAKMIPGDPENETRAAIRQAVEWSKTGRGGRNFDIEAWMANDDDPLVCESSYGLCE